MALLTLLPMGVLQLQAALENGYWYARSAEFMGKPIIHAAGVDARAGRHDLLSRRARCSRGSCSACGSHHAVTPCQWP